MLPQRKPSIVATTSLVLFDRLKVELAAGEINTHMLRAAFPSLTDRQFGMAIHVARKELERAGMFLKPVNGKPGVLRVATAEDVTRKVMDSSRMAVVRKIRQRGDLIVNAQKHASLDDESRSKLNAEEIVYSRFVQVAERMLLKAQRKRPEGLD